MHRSYSYHTKVAIHKWKSYFLCLEFFWTKFLFLLFYSDRFYDNEKLKPVLFWQFLQFVLFAKIVVGCWRVYLSGVRRRLAYGWYSWCHCHTGTVSFSVKSRLVLPIFFCISYSLRSKAIHMCFIPGIIIFSSLYATTTLDVILLLYAVFIDINSFLK